ncbi:general secretion pathway protein GspN [Stenotrophomonas sp. Iso1]|uniref:general secretion pathway protein GspN n=1 Tax=Stenotrophomonas sp. Iso1 TaxID=2977283 RepID=UPI0022B78268|nr:general secretion pathway protein GspN [Stenotrophomonas sp. Iso1]
MRNDIAGLRTWLLVAVGAWALAVWAATLFGLGSRIGAAPVSTQLPALPAVPSADAADTRAADNSEALARPLFASDRRPHPFVMGEGEQAAVGTVRLSGVLMTPELEMATLTTDQGRSLRLRVGGEPQDGWQLLSLQPRSAVVSGPSGTLNLELEVFSGGPAAKGEGAPPLPGATATAVPPPASSAPAAETAATPSVDQIQAIRERIQARRRQAQQNQNGGSGRQNP